MPNDGVHGRELASVPWDACLREDKTRSRNPNTVAALGLLRNCVLLFLDEDLHTSNLNAFTEATAADSDRTFEMLMREF